MAGLDGHLCPRCTMLKRHLGSALNDLNDVKRKLINVDLDRPDKVAHMRDRAATAKAALAEARANLAEHQAECEHAWQEAAPKVTAPVDSPTVEVVEPAPDPEPPADVLAPVPDDSWRDDALCAQTDPELFYPEKGGIGGSVRDAKKVCAKCEVREECLEDALVRRERFGIWGGLSERQRRAIEREREAHQEAS